MKKKGRLFVTLLISALISFPPVALIVGDTIIDAHYEKQVEKYKESYGELYDLVFKTDNGMPVRLHDFNKPITVALNGFNEKEKKEVVDAINRLDNISDSLSYVIYDNEDKKLTANINIYNDENYRNTNNHSLANTYFNCSSSSAEINYPITITIDKNCYNYYDEHGVNLLNYVIKHEMMHTLGFCDLYDEEYFNKSIMWFSVDNTVDVNDYTVMDEVNIKKLYDDVLIETEYPEYVKVERVDAQVPKKYEEDECENVM